MRKQPIKLDPLPPTRVEIINLIDVLITLIAFFLLTTVFASDRRQLGINLPQVGRAQAMKAAVPKILLQMDRSRRLFLNRQAVREADLLPLLQQQPSGTVVMIEADRACPYGAIVRVVDLVKQSRLTRVSLAVKQR